MKKLIFTSASVFLVSGLLLVSPVVSSAPAQMPGHSSPHSSTPSKGHPGSPSSGHGSYSGSYSAKGHAMGPQWKDTFTDKQKKTADALHLKLEKSLSIPKASRDMKKKELRLMVVQDSPKKAVIEEKIAEIMKIEAIILLSRIGHKIEMRRMLTPEQRTSFDMMILSGPPHGK